MIRIGIDLVNTLSLASKGYTVLVTLKDSSEIPNIQEAAHTVHMAKQKPSAGSIHSIVNALSVDSIFEAVKSIANTLSDPGSGLDETSNTLISVIKNASYCMISPMELTYD